MVLAQTQVTLFKMNDRERKWQSRKGKAKSLVNCRKPRQLKSYTSLHLAFGSHDRICGWERIGNKSHILLKEIPAKFHIRTKRVWIKSLSRGRPTATTNRNENISFSTKNCSAPSTQFFICRFGSRDSNFSYHSPKAMGLWPLPAQSQQSTSDWQELGMKPTSWNKLRQETWIYMCVCEHIYIYIYVGKELLPSSWRLVLCVSAMASSPAPWWLIWLLRRSRRWRTLFALSPWQKKEKPSSHRPRLFHSKVKLGKAERIGVCGVNRQLCELEWSRYTWSNTQLPEWIQSQQAGCCQGPASPTEHLQFSCLCLSHPPHETAPLVIPPTPTKNTLNPFQMCSIQQE